MNEVPHTDEDFAEIAANDAFLDECERRAGTSRDHIITTLAQYETLYGSDVRADWLRAILEVQP